MEHREQRVSARIDDARLTDPGSVGLTEGEAEVRRAAFQSIVNGTAPDAPELARGTGIGLDVVEDALGSLVRKGEAVVDGENRVVGTAGLSLIPARHRLRLGEREFHTWCAVDAIGIPAALGADAVARTACPTCGRPIEVAFRRGQAVDRDELRAWLPTLDCCTSVVDELCPEMNLFCSEAHLEDWRRRAGHPAGVVLTVEETEELGWRWWGGLA